MRLMVSIFVFLGLMGSGVLAEKGTDSLVKRGFLWKLEKGSQMGYLMGTIQFTSGKGLYPLRPEIRTAFDECTVLAVSEEMETDAPSLKKKLLRLSAPEQDKLKKWIFTLLQNCTYVGEDRLQNHVSPDTYTRLRAIARKWRLDLNQVDRFKPWFAGSFIFTQVKEVRSSTLDKSLQKYFREKATSRKDLVIWNSNLSGLLDLLNSDLGKHREFLESQNESLLKFGMAYAQGMKDWDDKLLKIWQTGDIREMEIWNEKRMKEFSWLRVIRQNKMKMVSASFVPRIITLLQSGSKCFVVLDAELLLGSDSLLAQWQRQGYQFHLI